MLIKNSRKEKYYQLNKLVFSKKESQESYIVQQKLNQETF